MARIGTSELDVFPLCLGGNVFGWTADKDASYAILDSYAESGGNFVDTADAYSAWVPGNGGGVSETYIGEWLASRGKGAEMVIATKVSQHPEFRGLSATNIAAAADASLARLGVDRIDLYYAHRDDPNTPLEQTAEAFDALVKSGKVRYVALSNYGPERVQEWLRIADAGGYARPVALQPHYNLVHRSTVESGEPSLASIAKRENLAMVPYYALASGFLTGKYRNAVGTDTERSPRATTYDTPRGRAIVDALTEVSDAHRISVTTAALAWLLAKPNVVAPIASASRPEQISDLVAVADVQLTPEEVSLLDDVSEGDPASA